MAFLSIRLLFISISFIVLCNANSEHELSESNHQNDLFMNKFSFISTKTIGNDKPSSPNAPYAKLEGQSSIMLSWVAPSTNGNEDITNYTIYIKTLSDTDYKHQQNVPGDQTGITIRNCLPGNTYIFAIAAVNNNGEGQRSNPSNAVTTPSPPSKPDPPTPTSATANSVTISFKDCENDGGTPIVRFKIFYKNITKNDEWQHFEEIPKQPVFGFFRIQVSTPNQLISGNYYVFKTRCLNAVDWSEPSEESISIRTLSIPNAPTEVEFDFCFKQKRAIKIYWTPPIFNGGSPITSYDIALREDDQHDREFRIIQHDINSKEVSAIIIGLKQGIRYTGKVRSINTVGKGLWSKDTSSFQTAGCKFWKVCGNRGRPNCECSKCQCNVENVFKENENNIDTIWTKKAIDISEKTMFRTHWGGLTCNECMIKCQNFGVPDTKCTRCLCKQEYKGIWCEIKKELPSLSSLKINNFDNEKSCSSLWELCKFRGKVNATCDKCDCNKKHTFINGTETWVNRGIRTKSKLRLTLWDGPFCNKCSLLCENGSSPDYNCTHCECRGLWTGLLCNVCALQIKCHRGIISPNCTKCMRCNETLTDGTWQQKTIRINNASKRQYWTGTLCHKCNLKCLNGGNLETNSCACNCKNNWVGRTCQMCQLQKIECQKYDLYFDSQNCKCRENCKLTISSCQEENIKSTLDSNLCVCVENPTSSVITFQQCNETLSSYQSFFKKGSTIRLRVFPNLCLASQNFGSQLKYRNCKNSESTPDMFRYPPLCENTQYQEGQWNNISPVYIDKCNEGTEELQRWKTHEFQKILQYRSDRRKRYDGKDVEKIVRRCLAVIDSLIVTLDCEENDKVQQHALWNYSNSKLTLKKNRELCITAYPINESKSLANNEVTQKCDRPISQWDIKETNNNGYYGMGGGYYNNNHNGYYSGNSGYYNGASGYYNGDSGYYNAYYNSEEKQHLNGYTSHSVPIQIKIDRIYKGFCNEAMDDPSILNITADEVDEYKAQQLENNYGYDSAYYSPGYYGGGGYYGGYNITEYNKYLREKSLDSLFM